MRLSIIVGTNKRTELLHSFLKGLEDQTCKDFEVIVADEGAQRLPKGLSYEYFHRATPYVGDWHQSAKEQAVRFARGEYLCFPNDDSEYHETFVEEMTKHDADLVICDWVWAQDGKYRMGEPKRCHVDVGGFVVRKTLFNRVGWQNKTCIGDGVLVEECAKLGSTHHVPLHLYTKH